MDKNILKSKTFWMSLVVAIAPLFPSVNSYVAANPAGVGMALGLIFGFLRLITKDKIVIM